MSGITTCIACNHIGPLSTFDTEHRVKRKCPACGSGGPFSTVFESRDAAKEKVEMAKGEKKKSEQATHKFTCEFGSYSRGGKTSGIGCKIAIASSKEPTKRREAIALLDRLFVGAQGKATLSFDTLAGEDVKGQTTMLEENKQCVGVADIHGVSIRGSTVSLKLSFNRDDEPEQLRDFSCEKGTLEFERTGEVNGDGEGDDA